MCRVHNFLLILGFWFMQVSAEELENLKRQRAQMRAASRALAQQEKNVKKRRARLLQAVFFVKRFFYTTVVAPSARGCPAIEPS